MKDVVYHYTDGTGLIGIISNQEIWCSNVLYLNDSLEWQYGVDVFEEMLQEIVDGNADPLKLLNAEWAKEIKRMFGKYYRAQKNSSMNTFAPCYAASFSEDPDSLPQWRGYSTKGARYAIGFHTAKLQALGKGTSLRKVEYKRDVAKELMRDELANMVKGTLASAGMDPVDWGARVCIDIGTACKDDAFKSECEVRLRFNGAPKEVHFRSGTSSLVPYFKLPIMPIADLIHSVWVGPMPHRDLAKKAVSELLKSNGVAPEGKVHLSKVPFRD